MKRLFLLIGFLFIGTMAFCQIDSLVTVKAVDSIYDSFLGNYIANHSWLIYVISFIALASEILANVKSVKSNSIFQLIRNSFQYLYNKIKSK